MDTFEWKDTNFGVRSNLPRGRLNLRLMSKRPKRIGIQINSLATDRLQWRYVTRFAHKHRNEEYDPSKKTEKHIKRFG